MPIDLKEIRFNITNAGVRSTVNLAEVVTIDETDVSTEFVKQAALQGWWGTLTENALHAYRMAEIDLDTVGAQLASKLRAELSVGLPAGKKPTEDQLKEALKGNPAYAAQRKAVEMARHNADLLKSALKAIEEKGKMLQSYGAYRRSEMDIEGLRTMRRSPA